MATKDLVIKRLRELHFHLLNTEQYPIHSYRRNRVLWEQRVLRELLLDSGTYE